jgi:MFS family permease
MLSRPLALLINAGHAVDHMFLLVFATAVSAIAADFGFERWEDLLPWGVGAAFMFGLGSIPAGRLGDLWGRRAMMLVFFFGMGASMLLIAATQNVWQMAAALTLMGAFSSIYHPVGVPMLVRNSRNPGLTIGFNGLVGNLGIAASALVTGLLIKYFGWRMAFVAPGLVSIGMGIAFMKVAPPEISAPASGAAKGGAGLSREAIGRVLPIMTLTAIAGSIVFNATTTGNQQLLTERFAGVIEDPAVLGALLGLVYVIASLSQLVVGRMIDRHPLKKIFFIVILAQAPLLALAAVADGWALLFLQVGFMIFVFGAVPFNDAMLVRYVDDSMRSRVSGLRLAVSFGFSSLAVWALGPVVKAAGFDTLLLAMAGIALFTLVPVLLLPDTQPAPRPAPAAV